MVNPDTLIKIEQICKDYGCRVIGDFKTISLSSFSQILFSNENSITWIGETYFINHLYDKNIRANCIITDYEAIINYSNVKADVLIITDKPKVIFSLLYKLSDIKKSSFSGIHPSAIIHKEAKIHETVVIGPLTYIGKATINAFTSILGSCFVGDNVSIGKNCNIGANAVIGAEGFGHSKDINNNWLQFPQIGKTIIEDNVDIGASSYITKGALGNTHIKRGVVIGLMCGVGHNAILEENAYVVSKSLIGGSSIIGSESIIGMQSVIRDGIIVGKNALVGMGAVVTKNVPDNEVWMGNPAKFYKHNND